ncbi:PCI domain-containing protein [Panaeolus papilionaceus]|nr:PCI domain-containing protein [Panaeolus papilionaceus]
MATATDSVSIFAEGTFEEQILELLSYIVRTKSEEERASFVAPFQNALKAAEGKKPIEEDEPRRKLVLSKLLADVKGLGDGTEREIEGFFNLLFAHLFAIHPADTPEANQYLVSLVNIISSSPEEQLHIKYRILSNLFNLLPRNSPQRSVVYRSLLSLASTNENLNVLELTKGDVERWLSEWTISAEEKASFLKAIVDAYRAVNQHDVSYEYLILYVQNLDSSSPEAKTAATELVATALRLPTVFNFDDLFKLDAVLVIKDHVLFSLLQIFLNSGLGEFNSWLSSNHQVIEQYQIPSSELERKIRLLTLASLAFQHVGQQLSYAKIAEALQIPPADVEKWVIDVIRAGLVWGKLSQTTQSLYITRATSRSFEKEQWQALEKRLLAWKSGLAGILDVVVNAKRQGGIVSA